MATLETMKSSLESKLRGIERYNPDNINILQHYVDLQVSENGYDLEANLALLKLYQFNPMLFNHGPVCKILLKALTNLPHSDFNLCKSLLSLEVLNSHPAIKEILFLQDLLETCQFKKFWDKVSAMADLVKPIAGFEDSIRKFVCHVIGITYQRIPEDTLCELLGLSDDNIVNQWVEKNSWTMQDKGYILVSSQEESIKTKKITEKIDLESVAGIMAHCV